MTTPIKHLKRSAEALEKAAKDMRKEIRRIEKDEQREGEVRSHFKRLRSIGRDIARAANYDQTLIISTITRMNLPADLSRETLAHHAREACKSIAAQRRAERNREILRLARRGITNSEISRRLKVSISTITRTISAEFRAP